MSIDHFNLRSFDLNLLVAFDAMVTEGSVTRAAQRLRIGQPAMSHSLSVLRSLLQDELFVRAGQAMRPTAKARSLAGPVRQALRQAQAALKGGNAFDPATEERVFRLAMTPEVEMLLVPDLTARLRRLAPGICILSQVFPYDAVEPPLEDGSVDLAVGCTYSETVRRSFETLFEVELSCCHNPALLPLPEPVPLEAFLAADHAVISQSQSLHGCMEEALATAGVGLNVVTAASGFMPVLAAAQASPVIATVPRRIAERYGRLLGLAVGPVPLALAFPPTRMAWASYADNDPANAWLRGQVRKIMAAAPSEQADAPNFPGPSPRWSEAPG